MVGRMEKKLILSGCLLMNDKREILLLKRKDHGHYETPGGKVESEGRAIDVTVLRETAERELREELGTEFEIDGLRFFSNVLFTIPDGRKAIANKFVAKLVSGEPKVNEPEIFSEMKWIPIDTIEKENISPDLKIIVSLLKKRL